MNRTRNHRSGGPCAPAVLGRLSSIARRGGQRKELDQRSTQMVTD